MKIALVYYSLEGNTAFAAEMIGQKLGVDIIRLKPVKDYPTGKIAKYFWAGKSASFQEAPKLMPYAFDINMYDVIILGTPIWASTFAPPLRTFIRAFLGGKKGCSVCLLFRRRYREVFSADVS